MVLVMQPNPVKMSAYLARGSFVLTASMHFASFNLVIVFNPNTFDTLLITANLTVHYLFLCSYRIVVFPSVFLSPPKLLIWLGISSGVLCSLAGTFLVTIHCTEHQN